LKSPSCLLAEESQFAILSQVRSAKHLTARILFSTPCQGLSTGGPLWTSASQVKPNSLGPRRLVLRPPKSNLGASTPKRDRGGARQKKVPIYTRTVQVWQCFVPCFRRRAWGKGQQRKQVFRIDVNGLGKGLECIQCSSGPIDSRCNLLGGDRG